VAWWISQPSKLTVLYHFRLSFVGDGMTACALGLAMGLGLLAATKFLGKETLHDMLTFNPGDFFTYAISHPLSPLQFCSATHLTLNQTSSQYVDIQALTLARSTPAHDYSTCSSCPSVVNQLSAVKAGSSCTAPFETASI